MQMDFRGKNHLGYRLRTWMTPSKLLELIDLFDSLGMESTIQVDDVTKDEVLTFSPLNFMWLTVEEKLKISNLVGKSELVVFRSNSINGNLIDKFLNIPKNFYTQPEGLFSIPGTNSFMFRAFPDRDDPSKSSTGVILFPKSEKDFQIPELRGNPVGGTSVVILEEQSWNCPNHIYGSVMLLKEALEAVICLDLNPFRGNAYSTWLSDLNNWLNHER